MSQLPASPEPSSTLSNSLSTPIDLSSCTAKEVYKSGSNSKAEQDQATRAAKLEEGWDVDFCIMVGGNVVREEAVVHKRSFRDGRYQYQVMLKKETKVYEENGKEKWFEEKELHQKA